MRQQMKACPYEAQTRASKCEGCCAKNGGLTPCVAAWLASKAGLADLYEPMRPILPEVDRGIRRAA